MTTPRERAWAATRLAPQAGLDAIGPRYEPWSQWARAVLLMATGDFAGSFALLEPLAGGDDEVAGLAAARIASGLRQIDEHAAAVSWDESAITRPGQSAVDGLIGRSADAVGAADTAMAAHYLARAHRQVSRVRDEVRVAWVATEISLLKGHQRVAIAHAERAHRLSVMMGSPRHLVKSALFWAAAARTIEPEVSFDLLHRGYSRAKSLALRPLLWPMVAVLGDAASPEQRIVAGQAVRFIAGHLPAGHGTGWARRADIDELRLIA